jgi:predicted dehydrogenase
MPMRRRDFITSAALAGGAQLLGTSRAWAGANDRIRVAIVGVGGRGRDHMNTTSGIPGVEIAAFCDPDQTRLNEKAAEFEKRTGNKRPALYQDLRRALEDKSIDAITVAACNHWHALATIWGCQAGKHVYVEKPLCHDMFSGAQMVAAARKYNRVVQGGTQRRSNGRIRKAMLALREGVIGDVYMSRCIHFQKRDSLGFKETENAPSTLNWDVWSGPGPMQPFHRNLHPYNWHWFWDYGNGELGNNGVHYIDVARWGVNKTLPSKIYSSGGRFGYKDQAQTPNTQLTSYEFDDGTKMVVEIRGRYTNGEGNQSSGIMFYGSKGYMAFDKNTESFQVFLEGRKEPEPDLGTLDDGIDKGDEDRSHFGNFFDAIRAGDSKKLTADVNETYLSTAFCLLGNISYRLGREVRFDPSARRFLGDHEADGMLREKYRAPYIIPEKV